MPPIMCLSYDLKVCPLSLVKTGANNFSSLKSARLRISNNDANASASNNAAHSLISRTVKKARGM